MAGRVVRVADQFLAAVLGDLNELFIDAQDVALEIGLRHDAGEVGDLGAYFQFRHLVGQRVLCGDVPGEGDDLSGVAGDVDDRVVGGMEPDFLATLPKEFGFGGLELPFRQIAPQLFVIRALAVSPLYQEAVGFAFDFVERIAQRSQEVGVGGEDGAVEVELDDRLRAVDGIKLGAQALHVHLGRRVDGTFGGGASVGRFPGAWIGGRCCFHGCLVCRGTTWVGGWGVSYVRRQGAGGWQSLLFQTIRKLVT